MGIVSSERLSIHNGVANPTLCLSRVGTVNSGYDLVWQLAFSREDVRRHR